jgi:hypothetical protein
MVPMDKKLKPSRFKGKAMIFIFIMAIFLILFSCATYSVKASGWPANINPFIKKFIADHTAQIGESEQLIFATNRDSSSVLVTIHAVERNNGVWHLIREREMVNPRVAFSHWGWLSVMILRL